MDLEASLCCYFESRAFYKVDSPERDQLKKYLFEWHVSEAQLSPKTLKSPLRQTREGRPDGPFDLGCCVELGRLSGG